MKKIFTLSLILFLLSLAASAQLRQSTVNRSELRLLMLNEPRVIRQIRVNQNTDYRFRLLAREKTNRNNTRTEQGACRTKKKNIKRKVRKDS